MWHHEPEGKGDAGSMTPESGPGFTQLSSIERPSIIECWAAWCIPCRRMAPELRKVASKYAAQVDLLPLDVEKDLRRVHALGVRSVPTLIAVRQGKEITRRTGMQSPEQIQALFEAARSGLAPSKGSLPAGERLLRLLAGGSLLLVGLLGRPSALLIGLGAAVAFTAVYDRCPIWRALTQAWRDRRS
jgi:thiol-disulfide isomerase/thioredoxin